jgi:hypothetical protein
METVCTSGSTVQIILLIFQFLIAQNETRFGGLRFSVNQRPSPNLGLAS